MCASARVFARTCARGPPAEDAVNWLRLTFSRGIVKGTVPPHLKGAICGARRRARLLRRVLSARSDESVACADGKKNGRDYT